MQNILFTKNHTKLLKIYFILTVSIFHIFRSVYHLPIMPYYGVVGFFIISGYGCYLSLQTKSFKKFIKNRISYIIIPYYIALTFYSIAHFQFGFYNPNTPLNRDIIGLITHILFIHNITSYTMWTISGVLWFIAPIMQFYFLSHLFKRFVDKYKFLPVILVFGIFISSNTIKSIFEISNLSFFGGRHIIYIAPFLSGMIIAKYKDYFLSNLSIIFNKLLIAIPYGIITLFITYQAIYSKNVGTITFVLLLSLPFLLFIASIFIKYLSLKTISFLGTFSFFVYLYNYSYIVFNPLLNIESNHIKTIAYFATILLVSYLFYFINNKTSKAFE